MRRIRELIDGTAKLLPLRGVINLEGPDSVHPETWVKLEVESLFVKIAQWASREPDQQARILERLRGEMPEIPYFTVGNYKRPGLRFEAASRIVEDIVGNSV
ncbi:MAG: hypothetical protein KDD55_12010 [Bdellovibrionales bacterium]|nr:hypothetical protein [Bdellovibrionales bacterium]